MLKSFVVCIIDITRTKLRGFVLTEGVHFNKEVDSPHWFIQDKTAEK